MLCPTTLLCRQHFEVASERFASFGIHIAMFSRLVPDKQQDEDIARIKEGKIDLIIGTHRLLSKDFRFKDLGLLVIDEEQRFGVEQKERIKEMSEDVALGIGGLPKGRIVEIYGPESSGKTTLALHVLAEAQKMGGETKGGGVRGL